MSFRKRSVGIQRTEQDNTTVPQDDRESVARKIQETSPRNIHETSPRNIQETSISPGVRPSPLTGQPTTSTGAYSLDSLLGGHAGLVLGSSLLVEESGTTDFAGALLRYYAAEGITQGHTLHVVGVGEGWVAELPGLVGAADAAAEAELAAEKKRRLADQEKMKIAWRYERLNQVDADRRGVLFRNL